MLFNMVAGLFILAYYVYQGLNSDNQRRWIPGFGMTGAIALTTGLHMVFTWPVIGSFNIIFGEMSVLLGIVFIGASISLAQGWDLHTVAIYAFFAGLAAIIMGARVIDMNLTRMPLLSGIGFILTGLAGICAAPTLFFGLQANRSWRLLGTSVLILAALIWGLTGCLAYWGHIDSYSKWQPLIMRSAPLPTSPPK